MGANLRSLEGPTSYTPSVRRGSLLDVYNQVRPTVEAMRRLSASWSAVARAIGWSEHDTRLAFDPAYEPDPMWLRPTEAPAPPSARKPALRNAASTSRQGCNSFVHVEAGSLRAEVLLAIRGGYARLSALQAHFKVPENSIGPALAALRGKGYIAPIGWREGWALTQAGEAEADRLAGP